VCVCICVLVGLDLEGEERVFFFFGLFFGLFGGGEGSWLLRRFWGRFRRRFRVLGRRGWCGAVWFGGLSLFSLPVRRGGGAGRSITYCDGHVGWGFCIGEMFMVLGGFGLTR
jgi:hypothetical protein